MKVACVGGGPGGLFFSALIKQAVPEAEVLVYERNEPDEAFGFGVVFSDRTLGEIGAADEILRSRLGEEGQYWERIEVRIKGQSFTCDGNGMAAITRRQLLTLLFQRAAEVGVDLCFGHEIENLSEVYEADLIVGADGSNSLTRRLLANELEPSIEVSEAKYIWLGTTYPLEGLTFLFAETDDGIFGAHCYPIGNGTGTFIVETDAATWRRAGLDEFPQDAPPGTNDEKSRAYLEAAFAEQMPSGRLLANNSRWANFRTIKNARWHWGNVVVLGDAAHTAHFSVGSGTKMAMEDGAALAGAVRAYPYSIEKALSDFENVRRPDVDRIQRAAVPSLGWWERFGWYYQHLEPTQFAAHFFTRSIDLDRLRMRDPGFVRRVESWWKEHHGGMGPLEGEVWLSGLGGVKRLANIEGDWNSGLSASFDEGVRVPLRFGPLSGGTDPWGLLIEAPKEQSELELVQKRLEGQLTRGPTFVAVGGGSRLARTAICEDARLCKGVPSMFLGSGLSEADAATLVLSGRADLVGEIARGRDDPWNGTRSE